jgi:hypothetical protein
LHDLEEVRKEGELKNSVIIIVIEYSLRDNK